jgi:hypothetical protein
MSNINEDTVLERFQAYLQDANKIGNALEMIIDDAVSESLSEGQALYIVENLILPQIVVRFALHLNDLNEMYGYEHSPHEVLSAFCDFNELSEDFQNDIAQEIVEAAAAHSDGDVDDEDVVFKREDWTKLSSAERQAKEKSFLRKLAAAHLDMRDLKPFIKDLDVGANPYGIYNGAKKYKAFDRAAHHYGHDPAPESYKEETFEEGTIQFPNSSGQGNDDEAQWHPLHKVALKHGYRYSHTTPIHQANGEVLHHHTWARGEHKIGAYAHDTQWSSKVSSASGHVWSGIGTVALDKHLANKAKRYKLQKQRATTQY